MSFKSDPSLSRLIPLVTAASAIVTVGCGTREQKIARQKCDSFRDCAPTLFSKTYEKFSDCVEEETLYAEQLAEYLAADFPEQCVDTYLDYTLCYHKQYACSDATAAYECEEEWKSVLRDCGSVE